LLIQLSLTQKIKLLIRCKSFCKRGCFLLWIVNISILNVPSTTLKREWFSNVEIVLSFLYFLISEFEAYSINGSLHNLVTLCNRKLTSFKNPVDFLSVEMIFPIGWFDVYFRKILVYCINRTLCCFKPVKLRVILYPFVFLPKLVLLIKFPAKLPLILLCQDILDVSTKFSSFSVKAQLGILYFASHK